MNKSIWPAALGIPALIAGYYAAGMLLVYRRPDWLPRSAMGWIMYVGWLPFAGAIFAILRPYLPRAPVIRSLAFASIFAPSAMYGLVPAFQAFFVVLAMPKLPILVWVALTSGVPFLVFWLLSFGVFRISPDADAALFSPLAGLAGFTGRAVAAAFNAIGRFASPFDAQGRLSWRRLLLRSGIPALVLIATFVGLERAYFHTPPRSVFALILTVQGTPPNYRCRVLLPDGLEGHVESRRAYAPGGRINVWYSKGMLTRRTLVSEYGPGSGALGPAFRQTLP